MRSLVIGLSIACVIIVIDQYSKIAIFDFLHARGGFMEVFPFFNLVMVYNTGISFGIGTNLNFSVWLFSLLALVIVAILLPILKKETTCTGIIAFGLIIGGAIGNVIDRVRIGAVIDFIDVHIGGYHWPAFNVADSAIFIGAALLIVQALVKEKKAKNDAS